jgi:hypothetical protein
VSRPPARWTAREEAELRTLVETAWELRRGGSPYFWDACAEITRWHDRRWLARYEAEREADGLALRLLREANEVVRSTDRAVRAA